MGGRRDKKKAEDILSKPLAELGGSAKGYIIRTKSESEPAGALQEKIFVNEKEDKVTVIDIRRGRESGEIHDARVREVDEDTARREQERMRRRMQS